MYNLILPIKKYVMNRFRTYVFFIFLLFAIADTSAQEKITIALCGDSRENLNHACKQIATVLKRQITDWDIQIHTGDFVFNGHAHVYVRIKRLLPDGIIDEKKGIVHIINGMGGTSWKYPLPMSPQIVFTPSVKSFPVITFITFDGNTAKLRTVDARPESHLKIIDTCIITK